MTIPGGDDSNTPALLGVCPTCQTPLQDAPSSQPTDNWSRTCSTCGHVMAEQYLTERVSLRQWRDWADLRLAWLDDRLASGDPPTESTPQTSIAHPQGRPATASGTGGVLLTAGAVLLVLAGIAFVAFAWDLLGPVGQVLVLYLFGAAGLATLPLSRRLPGTATAIGITGTLIVCTASIATRLLGEDSVGTQATCLAAVATAAMLATAGVVIRDHCPPVGEVAASLGAVLALTFVGFAPSDGAIPLDDPWLWWTSLTFVVGGLGLLIGARTAKVRSWPSLGAASLVSASIALAVDLSDSIDSDAKPFVHAVVYLVAAVAILFVWALLRRQETELVIAASLLLTMSAVSSLVAGSVATQRPAAVILLVVTGVTVRFIPTTLTRIGAPLVASGGHSANPIAAMAGWVVIGAACGYTVAPWLNWPAVSTDAAATIWLGDAWPVWRGIAAGALFSALLAITAIRTVRWEATRESLDDWTTGLVPILSAAAAVAVWLTASFNQVAEGQGELSWRTWTTVTDTVLQRVAVALLITGFASFVLVALRRLPLWTLWIGNGIVVAAVLVQLGTVNLPHSASPELYSLALFVPTAAAGTIAWWRTRPAQLSTWISVAPALTLALLPPVIAVFDDATNRWWGGGDPAAGYQVRVVALVAVGAILAFVGARQRLAGVLFPGLATLLAITVIECIELGRFLPQWISFAFAGAILIGAGARWESVRKIGRDGSVWVRALR